MQVVVDVGSDHGCCGPAIERNQLVDLGCVRTTGPDGLAGFTEVRHDLGPDVRVRGRVTDVLVVRADGTASDPVEAGTAFQVVVHVLDGSVDL